MARAGLSHTAGCARLFGQSLIGLLLLWVLTAQTLAQTIPADIRFKRLLSGEESGTNDNINAITAIVQDSLGFMWFGGENGLARYNGETFEIFQTDSLNPRSLSGSYVWDVVEDHAGVLWVATGQGLNRLNPARHDFSRFTTTTSGEGVKPAVAIGDDVLFSLAVGVDNTLYIGSSAGLWLFNPERTAFSRVGRLREQYIRAVTVDRQGVVWIGTSERGLWRWDPQKQHWQNWQQRPGDEQSLPSNYVRAITEDASGRIWVGTLGGGVARLHEDGQRFTRYQHDARDQRSIGSNNIWDLHVDKGGNLWVASDPGGLSLYLPEHDSFRTYRHSPYSHTSLNSNKIRAIYHDHLDDLWVGAFPSGVNYFDKSTALFNNYTAGPEQEASLSHESVLRFFEDSKQRVWIGTEYGLNRFDPETKSFVHYLPEHGSPGELQAGTVLSLADDAQGLLWVGTWSGGVHRLDPETGEFSHYLPVADDPHSLGDAYVWSIVRDHQDRMWLGTESTGLHLYDRDSDSFIRFEPDPDDPHSLSFRHVWSLMVDEQGQLWVGTIDGLDLLVKLDGERAQFRHFRHDPSDPGSLSSNRIISLYEDSRGFIWVGTQDAGLNRLNPNTSEVVRVSTVRGMPSAHVSSIIEDSDGFIWASTVNGIAIVDPETFAVRTLGESNGLIGNNFNRDASYKDQQGRLYFGATEGFSVFDPSHFNAPNLAPEVIITDFRLFNRTVYADGISPLQNAISQTKQLTLSHRHTMFAFDFYALSYRSSHRNQYAYMLEGFDQQWNHVGNKNTATYTNIDPGTYTFTVRAANSDGVWNRQGKSITITIIPPWWRTAGAYAAYVLFVVLAIALLVTNQRKRLAFRHQKALNEKLLKVDRLKNAFLANTSHELRTPLNGIIGLAEAMQEGAMGDVGTSVRHGLKMISSSGRRLSSLVNDILDFSKLSDNTLQVDAAAVPLMPLVDTALGLVTPLKGDKPLTLINDVSSEVCVSADDNRVQQILLNLLSNAVKFSRQGHVRVYAQKQNRNWAIFVEDTGVGISEPEREKVFDAFTQLDQEETREHGGAGLGLAICKRLVELHGGTLSLRSQAGIGSTFVFTLPACEMPITGAELVPPIEADEDDAEKLTPIISSGSDEVLELLQPKVPGRHHSVLVVDDDAVNRLVLRSMLELHNYRVLEAECGAEALAVLERGEAVDLVLMDVMMPKMTGYEACMRIRVARAVHILPVLFLTAKNFSDDLVRGFVAGGNDFLTKPISKHELLSRVSVHLTLLDVNRRLQNECSDARAVLQSMSRMTDHLNGNHDQTALLRAMLDELARLCEGHRAFYWQEDAQGCGRGQLIADGNAEPAIHELAAGAALARKLVKWPDAVRLDFAELKANGEPNALAAAFAGYSSGLLLATAHKRGPGAGLVMLLRKQGQPPFSAQALAALVQVRGLVIATVHRSQAL